MIGVFPDPFPGEIFYSICARLGDRLGYLSRRSVMQELFGSETVVASIVLPSHLEDVAVRLPPGSAYTSEYLIGSHTLLPFYSPFLPPERLDLLLQDMLGRNGSALHMRSGIMASHIPLPEWLRYCTFCVLEDRRRFGECYWHRVHQISGIEICPFHEVSLSESTVRVRNNQARHEFVSARSALQKMIPTSSISRGPYHDVLLNLARDAHWLLNQHCTVRDYKLLHRRYRSLLAEVDMATFRGRVDTAMFLQKFRNCYSPQLLELLHCELEEHVKELWLLRLVRTPHSAQHPLFHLLLIHFLGYTAETFFSLPVQSKPFGDGPWPCLNPACGSYRNDSIEVCQIVYSQYVSGKPIGTFGCICGFAYSRTGPDEAVDDRFKRGKVKAFGPLWETRLRDLWKDEAVSLREIARRLDVDPLTIKRHARRFGLAFPRSANGCSSTNVSSHIVLPLAQVPSASEVYRAKWLTTTQENPDEGIKMLRSRVPRLYAWLYRHDKAWLQEQLYLRKSTVNAPSHRVDWEARDLLLVSEVETAATRLKHVPGHPVRVTISSIGREIGRLALLQQHLDKLPTTAKALEELVESRESYAVRRVQWASADFRQKGISPAPWLLVRVAGVAHLVGEKRVRDAIDARPRAP